MNENRTPFICIVSKQQIASILFFSLITSIVKSFINFISPLEQMRELVNIGIGQAGIQISSTLLEMYTQQHSITVDGKRQQQSPTNNNNPPTCQTHSRQSQLLSCMFQQNEKSILNARFMLVDSQPDVIDTLNSSKYKELLNPYYMIAGKQSANTYAAGYYRPKTNRQNQTYENTLKKIVEKCDSVEGFLMTHAIEGGTGSGTGSLLMQILHDTFPKSQLTNFLLTYQSRHSTTPIGPINSVLAMKSLSQFSHLSIMFDNFSLNQIFQHNLDVLNPNYNNLNSLIAQIHSAYTLPMRFLDNRVSCDIKQIQTNLIHFPDLIWVLPSFSPLINQYDATNGWSSIFSFQFLVDKCLDTTCQLANYPRISINRGIPYSDFHRFKKISTVLLARGDVNQNEFIEQTNQLMQKKSKYNFNNKTIKIGITPHRPTQIHLNQTNKQLKTSVTALTSTHQSKQILIHAYQRFMIINNKRAFRHWFTRDGMEMWEDKIADIPNIWNMYRQEISSCEQHVYG